jgi:hypothetical protein
VRPVLEHQQRPVDDGRILGRNLQLEDGLVKAGVGVDVRAEAHADRLHEPDDPLIREVGGAVERHVLDEVGEPALVVVLEDRAGADHEPELGAVAWRPVGAHVITKAIRQRADRDPRVGRYRLRERRGGGAGRDRELPGCAEPGRGHAQRQHDHDRTNRPANVHRVLLKKLLELSAVWRSRARLCVSGIRRPAQRSPPEAVVDRVERSSG